MSRQRALRSRSCSTASPDRARPRSISRRSPQAIRAGRQTLVLLPEIALTEPFLKRFAARFGCAPVAWHSDLRQSQRRRAWRAIASGEALVMVGARSALFLPYRNLGLIVVDEAHETSFKQEDGVHYHARDVAVMRGQFEECPVILASATPAIETRQQVALGRYAELKLPGRYGAAEMPAIAAIDLIANPPDRGRWLAPKLVKAIDGNARTGRTGAAVPQSPRLCAADPVPDLRAPLPMPELHRLDGRAPPRPPARLPSLRARRCRRPRACPECEQEDTLVACGPGVERIADEVTALFPDAKTAIVTSDTIWSPAKAAEFVHRMEAGEIDIVVGTQLVTKGYHFPNLTLVGVIDADLGLDGGDLRAAERTFQQIMQVAGRAGRGAKPGHVFIQTHSPDAPVMRALVSGDADSLLRGRNRGAARGRRAPFRPLSPAIVVSSEDQTAAHETATLIGRTAPQARGDGGLWPRPRPARDAARPPPLPPARPCPPRARRAGRDPRLARQARLVRQGPRRGRRRSVQLFVTIRRSA